MSQYRDVMAGLQQPHHHALSHEPHADEADPHCSPLAAEAIPYPVAMRHASFPPIIGSSVMSQHLNYIAGEWVEGKTVIVNMNPSDLDDVVGHYASGDEAATAGAVAAAKAAFPQWASATPQARADFLDAIGNEILARKEEIGRLLSREEGKPLADGIAE